MATRKQKKARRARANRIKQMDKDWKRAGSPFPYNYPDFLHEISNKLSLDNNRLFKKLHKILNK